MSQNLDTKDDSYVSRTGQSEIPVDSDNKDVKGGYENPESADSDAQLKKDDTDAIDSSNIIDERTRGASKNYQEPSDDLDIPNDGRSAVSGGTSLEMTLLTWTNSLLRPKLNRQ